MTMNDCETCRQRRLLSELREVMFRLTGYAHSGQDQAALVAESRQIYDTLTRSGIAPELAKNGAAK